MRLKDTEPSIKQIASKPYGRARLRNHKSSGDKFEFEWNPHLASRGLVRVKIGDSEALIEAQQALWYMRAF